MEQEVFGTTMMQGFSVRNEKNVSLEHGLHVRSEAIAEYDSPRGQPIVCNSGFIF